jgi:Enoyl-(Acyl carrier protein) reductase
MSGRVEGKVAFITGAGRGEGARAGSGARAGVRAAGRGEGARGGVRGGAPRSAWAEEGADIVAVPVSTPPMVAGPETTEPLVSRSPELGAIFADSLPVGAINRRDVSSAVLWLASDEARYVTGAALTVDAGNTIR